MGVAEHASFGDANTELLPNSEAARKHQLEAIFTRHYARLLDFLKRRTGSPEDAADATQEAFARLAGSNLNGIKTHGAYLYTTALNFLRDRARRPALFIQQTEDLVQREEYRCCVPDAERTLDGKEQLRILEGAIGELSPKCQAVLILFRFDEMSHQQIADKLGISVSSVEKYVRKALKHCRERLDHANSVRPMSPK